MTYSEIGAEALREAARFYRMVADQNPELNDTLGRTANAFEEIARGLAEDPEGVVTGLDDQ